MTRKLHECFRITPPSSSNTAIEIGARVGTGSILEPFATSDMPSLADAKEELRRRFGQPRSGGPLVPSATVLVPLSMAASVAEAAFSVLAARSFAATADPNAQMEACQQFALAQLCKSCLGCRLYIAQLGPTFAHSCHSSVDSFLAQNLSALCLMFYIPVTQENCSHIKSFLQNCTFPCEDMPTKNVSALLDAFFSEADE